jgi:hypothetical protein
MLHGGHSVVGEFWRGTGLLLEEIPGILNMCTQREPVASCPVDSYAASLS